MRITIIGPGSMSIPPTGWGAVEILIWDYKETLEKIGETVTIVNTNNVNDIINQVNNSNPDFVHIQYDDWFFLWNSFNCKKVAITSHYAYLEQVKKHGGYEGIFNGFVNSKANIFCLSDKISNLYESYGVNKERSFVIPNGVRNDLFKFSENCERPNDSIYLAKIDYRKRQYKFHDIKNLYFAGNIADNRYNKNNYLGEWSKSYLYDNLTNFANLILLSDGEAHPLVCMEAMSAGLGLVISQYSTANLDLSKPFIDVIPEEKINDNNYISEVIELNRKKSVSMRQEIRKYVLENFSWETIVKDKYIPSILNIK